MNKYKNYLKIVFLFIGLLIQFNSWAQDVESVKKEKTRLPYQFEKGLTGTTEIGGEAMSYAGAFKIYQTLGYKVNPWVSISGGTGVNIILYESYLSFLGSAVNPNPVHYEFPIDVDLKINFINKRNTPFFDLTNGVKIENVSTSNNNFKARYNWSTGLGGAFRISKKAGIILSAGYSGTYFQIDKTFDNRGYGRIGYMF